MSVLERVLDRVVEKMEGIWTWCLERGETDGWDWLFAHILVPGLVLGLSPLLLANDSLLAHEASLSAFRLDSGIQADGSVVDTDGVALVLEPQFPSFSILSSPDAWEPQAAKRSLDTSLPFGVAASHLGQFTFTRYGVEVDAFDIAEPLVVIVRFPPKGTVTIGSREIALELLEPPSELSRAIMLGAGLSALFGFGWIFSQGRREPRGNEYLRCDKAADENKNNIIDGDR